jgi:signal transduction histidine kinase/ActR/RegA family two-component response regulator
MLTGVALLSQLPLDRNHFPDFYQVAKRFSENEGYNVTLADSDGNQFLSTRLPLGATLPHRGAMDSVHKAIASGQAHASEVFPSKITGNYVVTVDAPVSTTDGLRIITLSVDPTSIAKVMSRTSLPEGWLMGLIDEHGVFIARSKDQDQWIGKPSRPELVDASRRSLSGIIYNKSVEGFPILNVFNRVPGTDWTVLIGVPESVLYAPVIKPVGLLAGLILLTATLTALLALVLYRRLKVATARLLAIARDPFRSAEGTAAWNTFAEFEVVAQTLENVAGGQQRLMAELNHSKDRYYTLFKSMDESFCLIEMIYDEHEIPIDWRFLEVNPAFEKQNGLFEATGKRIRELVPDLEPHWFKIYGEVARTGEPTRFQNEAKTLGDRWFDLYAFRIGEPGNYKVAVLFSDITHSKHMEDALRLKNTELETAKAVAEEASLAKSNFLSSMSHELRTPLNAILGFAQLIDSSTSPPTPVQKRSIDQILTAGWFLLELVNEILDLAHIESGKVVMSREAVPLEHVMSECQALVEPLAHKRGIDISFTRLDRPHYVDADRTRIRQVLINLLNNAIKYNKPAGMVTMGCTLAPPNSIRISVRDTGLGLSPEQLGQLFQPFNRLGRESTGEQGTGIGLVVVKRLVELMGGTVGVDSQVGVGSVFWIELKLTTAPQLTIGETEQAVLASLKPANGTAHRTVLYVEDNLANLALVEELVTRSPNLRLISAADGNLGVEYARTYLPEVILMDLHLPGISGIEAMKVLRADPTTAHIPVIALSAYALSADIELALEAGFFNYITKPIRLNEFMAALDAALKFALREPTGAANKA